MLRASLAVGLSPWFVGRPWAALADGSELARNLVLVQLTGGNDGLDTLVPYADDAYHAARPGLRVAARDVLALDERFGLHPALRGLRALFDEGRVAVVQGVGYPRPNRSHFRSLEIWHSAAPDGTVLHGPGAHDGWIGRLQRIASDAESRSPNRVVHLGERAPHALHSSVHPPTSFVTPAAFVRAADGPQRRAERRATRSDDDAPLGSGSAAPSALGELRRIAANARASSKAIRTAAATYEPHTSYPSGAFGQSLKHAAALLAARIGTRIISLELGGFDTHSGQRERRAKLLAELDAGLLAFVRDLAGTQLASETLVVVYSEFGRRLAENASGGTDHGAAGPVLVLQPAGGGGGAGGPAGCAAFRPGLHGRAPSLSELDERGDLRYTVDFRTIYAALVRHWFGLDSAAVLGQPFESAPFLA